ncbi:MAG TPA: hypothetical protein VK608_16860 [Edaphobacter sp.]|nr:hypothetical protein [Edaphobacter sp.]
MYGSAEPRCYSSPHETAAFIALPVCAECLGQSQLKVVSFVDGPCCKVVWQNGKAFYLIQDENVSVMVSGPSNYSARLHSVYVQVRQDGDGPLDVNPADFKVIADDDAKTEIPYLDMDVKAEHDRKHKSLISGILLGIASGASGAAAAAPQMATVNNSDGTSSTITYSDPAAQANANAEARADGKNARANIQAVYDAKTSGLLRHNTLQKSQIASGNVYFEGPKGMKNAKKDFTPLVSIDILINGTIYRFQ